MINVDKILKVMCTDLPANFDKGILANVDKGILASELRKAESWYQTRSNLDKWPKREKIISRLIKDTERYRAALEAYSDACQDIPLRFELPSWLNTEALDDVLTEAKACIRPLQQNAADKQEVPKILIELGVDRGSPMDFLLGSMLPKIFRKCFKIEISIRDSTGRASKPFVSFAVEAARQIVGKIKAPRPESVASSYRTMNTPGASRRRRPKIKVQT